MNVENLLEAVSKEINILKTARERYAKQLAPGFSVFNYIYTDEMMLSRIIADLLNPKGKHAQGSIFLKLFFEQFGLGQVWQDKELERAQKIQVEPEVLTDLIERKQRRIDILIKFENPEYFLCIENKPFAADQYKQLEDYAMQLHLSCNQNQQNWHLIYLSGYGNPPSTNSVEPKLLQQWIAEKKFSQVNYPDLVDWLKQCVAHCRNHKVVNFLNEFQNYILREFAGIKDMSEQDVVVKIIEETDNLKAAIAIAQAKDVMQLRMLQSLNEQLKSAVRNSQKNWFIEGEGFSDKAQEGLNIHFLLGENQENLHMRIVFFKPNYNGLSFGICNANKNLEKNPEVWSKIYELTKSVFNEEDIKSDKNWWPFYIQLEDVENGGAEMELWQQIQSGTLCKRIMDYAEKTSKALEDAKLLDQL